MRIYIDPRTDTKYNGLDVEGIYLDAREKENLFPSDIVDALRDVGIDPKKGSGDVEIMILMDPEKPPRGLDTLSRLWKTIPVLDLERLKKKESLEAAQRSFTSIALRIHRKHLQFSLGVIALLVPEYTVVPLEVMDLIKYIKICAGASAGQIIIESCSPEIPNGYSAITGGIAIIGCSKGL